MVSMKFTTSDFEQEVLHSATPVMVDFYADWCGPCRMMAPVVEELGQEYAGRVKIGKVNVDDDPDIAEKYSVMSIPTFLIFKDGKPVETAIGSVPKSTLQEKLERALH